MHDAHAFATTTCDGFDDDREADALRFFDGFSLSVYRAVGAWYGRDFCLCGGLLGDGFVAHQANVLRAWADKLDICGSALLGKTRFL